MESREDNNKRVFSGHFLFRTLICHRLFQNKAKLRVFNFGWPLNRGKDNREPSLARPKGGRGPLKEMAG